MLGFISIKTKSTSITRSLKSCRIWGLPNSRATSQALHSLLVQWKFAHKNSTIVLQTCQAFFFSPDLGPFLFILSVLYILTQNFSAASIPHLLVVIASCIFPLQHFSQLYLFNYAIMAEYLLSCANPLTCTFQEIRVYIPLKVFTLLPVIRQQLHKGTLYALVDKFGDATAKLFTYVN